MSRIPHSRQRASMRTLIKLHEPPTSGGDTARWRINGHGATIIIWTSDQWERLKDRPTDAQYYPCGVWCALRMD